MKMLKSLSVLLAVFIFTAAPSFAEKLMEPSVEYSADTFTQTDTMTLKGKVYHAMGKERQEQTVIGMKQVVIVRTDKNVVWVLMPERRMYMEHSLQERGAPDRVHGPGEFDYDYKVVGEEIVNGIRATKSRMTATSPDGIKFAGFIWVTKDGILVKMDSSSKGNGAPRMHLKTELRNLKIGKQESSLFEIPEGYTKMTGFGMGGGFDTKKMEEMMKGMTPPPAPPAGVGE